MLFKTLSGGDAGSHKGCSLNCGNVAHPLNSMHIHHTELHSMRSSSQASAMGGATAPPNQACFDQAWFNDLTRSLGAGYCNALQEGAGKQDTVEAASSPLGAAAAPSAGAWGGGGLRFAVARQVVPALGAQRAPHVHWGHRHPLALHCTIHAMPITAVHAAVACQAVPPSPFAPTPAGPLLMAPHGRLAFVWLTRDEMEHCMEVWPGSEKVLGISRDAAEALRPFMCR